MNGSLLGKDDGLRCGPQLNISTKFYCSYMRRKRIYISPDVLCWRAMPGGGIVLPERDKRRAYEHLRRAEHFLSLPNNNEADLADSLSNLRRALTHRIQVLDQVYRLRIPLDAGEKKPFLELLAQIGAVRPTLLKALLEARNAVEYNDRRPPSKKRCQELADSVWYFLRSTDTLVTVQRSDIELTPPEDGNLPEVYHAGFRIIYSRRFRVEFSGWFPEELVSFKEKSWWAVEAEDYGTKVERWGTSPLHQDKKASDIWVRGVILNDPKTVCSVLAMAFGAE